MNPILLAVLALGCVTLGAIVGFALARRDVLPPDPEPDDVQPWDQHSVTLASGNAEWVN